MRSTARAHFLDREKRIEVGLRLLRRAVELAEERVRTASATLICQDDIAPGPSAVARHNRVAEKLGRRLTGTSGEIHDGIVATRLAIDSRRRQHNDAEGDGAAATRGLILVDGEAVASSLGHGNARRASSLSTPAGPALLSARDAPHARESRPSHASHREHGGGERHTGPPSPKSGYGRAGRTPRHRLYPCLLPRLLSRLVGRDVLTRELLEVRRVDEADFPAFFERSIRRKAIA